MNIEAILREMTLEEKASLCQGSGFWHTAAVPRLGIPDVMMSDGPHGLRKQVSRPDHLGLNESEPAVCFPTAAGLAASFDRDLARELGTLIGQSAQAEHLGIVLGPAANIKRSPLCGRNFEYFSEDPLLSAETAAAYIEGVQSQGVGTSLKHFAANNQETRRQSVDEAIGERALREIYLASFEAAVRKADPWTVMCSYNKVNGTYASENRWLLTEVLRDEWGYPGMVLSDWGAVSDRVKGLEAGMDLQMPRAGDHVDRQIVEAVRSGRLPEQVLDTAVRRVLALVRRVLEGQREPEEFDWGMQHHQARKLAREAMVLLKNDDGLLPVTGNKKVAFIGTFAEQPRFQGGGSSHIRCTEILSALQAVRSVSPVTYAKGFDIAADAPDPALEAEAVRIAAEADIAILFLGLPDTVESEGYDRRDMKLPACQNHLVEAVAAVQPRVAVVLHNGAPVEMPWIDKTAAVLEAYLGGQAVGGAVVDLLFGAVSPCGKLAETFPLRLEDTPAFTDFPGDGDRVRYSEGIYTGYRWYDKRRIPVLFPFGHGLTYTSFTYDNLRLSADRFDGNPVTVCVDVTNTGRLPAKEIVQFYVRPLEPQMSRPVRELKGYGKIALAPGETGTVTVTLDRGAFAYWEERTHGWRVEGGPFAVEAAASSRDIRCTARLEVAGDPLRLKVTADSTLGDVLQIPGIAPLFDALPKSDRFRRRFGGESSTAAVTPVMLGAMMRDLPLHRLTAYGPGSPDEAALADFIRRANELQGF